MNTPKPAELAETIVRLEGDSIDPQEMEQLVEKARDVETHLARVAKPIPDPSKGPPRPPSYAFGPQNAARAERALPYARNLIDALHSTFPILDSAQCGYSWAVRRRHVNFLLSLANSDSE